MLSVVQRQFKADQPLAIGTVIDTSGWRLERQLREQGFIRPATEGEIAEAKPARHAGEPASAVKARKPAAKKTAARRSARA